MKAKVNPTLYQINTRTWMNELSRKLGRPVTLSDVDDEFIDSLVARGFDWLWPLGVWQTGLVGRSVSRSNPQWVDEFRSVLPDISPQDITGSPFAIRAYRVHEDFGGNAALAQLRMRLKRRGIRLLLDFVPNHTARDHYWVTTHPEYYVDGDEADLEREPHNYARVQTVSGSRVFAFGRDPYFPGWPDTFQLNYRESACRKAMAEELRAVSTLCDGVRCDMAMLLLPDVICRTWGARALPADGSPAIDTPFWPEAIAGVREQKPNFLFMAEVYWDREWDLQRQGFDYTYDKRLYDRLCSRNIDSVRSHLLADPEFQSRSVRFLENHDEPRASATFPRDILRAANVIACAVPGLRFFYEGQLEGRRRRVPMHLGRRPDEPVDVDALKFYERLLQIIKRPVLRQGRWRMLTSDAAWVGNPTAHDVLAFSWELNGDRVLVAVNYADTRAQCYVRLPWSDLSGRKLSFRDQLSDAKYDRAGEELQARGLYLDVPAWQTHIFEVAQG
ncbi:MAG TPA: alpha-amylase family glycosyl hydrolase [Polyangiales bacterium]|nr:alpha-amylase family glycosyl hydrolase [Polyangiales bacterium]